EDDDFARDLVERKEAAQKFGTLAGVDAGLVLLGANVDDAARIDAEASESIDEFFSLLDPRLAPNTIEPELPVKREEDGRCTVYTVGPDNGDDAVRELGDCGARFWRSAAGRRVARTPIGTVAREREVDACHEPLEVSLSLPLALPLKHHLCERVDID